MSLSPSLDTVRSLYTALVDQSDDCTVFLGECFLHTVEALVEIEEAESIDPLPLFVLRAFEFAQPTDAEHLDSVLHIGRQVMRQVLNDTVTKGLVATDSECTFRLTDDGRRTLQEGQAIRRVRARRVFRFLHPAMSYVAVNDRKGNLLGDLSPSRAPSPWEFDADTLRQTIAQPADWKQRHRFPTEIVAVITQRDIQRETDPASPSVDRHVVRPPATQQQTEMQHLMVDKAQVAACAFVVRRKGVDAVSLSAYPISAHGKLARGKERPLFSLHTADEIGHLVPMYEPLPSQEEAIESWLQLAAQLKLPEPEHARVTFENSSLVIRISADQIDRWTAFVAVAMQEDLLWQVPRASVRELCSVTVAGIDAEAAARLDLLRCILALENDMRRDSIMQDAASVREWLAGQALPLEASPRDLADDAFQFGKYRLAYALAELEDMIDAAV